MNDVKLLLNCPWTDYTEERQFPENLTLEQLEDLSIEELTQLQDKLLYLEDSCASAPRCRRIANTLQRAMELLEAKLRQLPEGFPLEQLQALSIEELEQLKETLQTLEQSLPPSPRRDRIAITLGTIFCLYNIKLRDNLYEPQAPFVQTTGLSLAQRCFVISCGLFVLKGLLAFSPIDTAFIERVRTAEYHALATIPFYISAYFNLARRIPVRTTAFVLLSNLVGGEISQQMPLYARVVHIAAIYFICVACNAVLKDQC